MLCQKNVCSIKLKHYYLFNTNTAMCEYVYVDFILLHASLLVVIKVWMQHGSLHKTRILDKQYYLQK